MQNHILSIILFTPLIGALRAPVRSQGEQGRHPLDREFLRARRIPDLAAAGADVLGAALRARLQVHRGHAQQLDPLDRRRLRDRHRRHFFPAHHAHHAAGLDLDPLFLDRHREFASRNITSGF